MSKNITYDVKTWNANATCLSSCFHPMRISLAVVVIIRPDFRFTILTAILVTKPEDLRELVNSESRVMLLYSTREEAIHILSQARHYNITGENYVWVVTQSVIGDLQAPGEFPIGMLGKSFAVV